MDACAYWINVHFNNKSLCCMYQVLNQGGSVAESQVLKRQILYLINVSFLIYPPEKNHYLKQAETKLLKILHIFSIFKSTVIIFLLFYTVYDLFCWHPQCIYVQNRFTGEYVFLNSWHHMRWGISRKQSWAVHWLVLQMQISHPWGFIKIMANNAYWSVSLIKSSRQSFSCSRFWVT